MAIAKIRNPDIPTFKSLGDGPVPPGTSASGMYLLPAGFTWDDRWRLAENIVVEVRITSEAVLLLSHGALEEYGAGDTLDEAIWDFLTGLSDLRQSDAAHEDRLAPDDTRRLATLRRLIHPASGP